MIRRLPIACLALVAVATATGCTTFSNNDAVAKVGDETLTRDEFADLLPDAAGTDAAGGGTATTVAADDETIAGNEARGVIDLWVVGRLMIDEVTRTDGNVTDADREAAKQVLTSDATYSAGSEAFKQMFVEAQAAYIVWGRELAESSGLQDTYEQGPAASGIACVAHILVATEQEAEDVFTELENGTPFAELARTRSTDTQSGQAGGALGCVPTEQFQSQFVPEFVDGALGAEVGVPTQPVKSDFGYHIIQLQPYDEVIDQIGQAAVGDELTTLRESADVYIDPRYGHYETGRVTPLNGPTPTSSP